MQSSSTRAPEAKAAGGLYSLLASALMIIIIFDAARAVALAPTAVANPAPTAAELVFWSVVRLAKPTQTSSAVPTPTPGSLDAPVATAAAVEATSALTMSIVEEATDSPLDSGLVPAESAGKRIVVSTREQHLYGYDGDKLVYSFVASTGMGNSTRFGTFSVLDKIPNAYGANWNIWMPDWLGIYWSGSLENGIHALPILPGGARLWSGFLGTPISYGCVVLGADEARQLYNWVEIGTPVEIRW